MHCNIFPFNAEGLREFSGSFRFHALLKKKRGLSDKSCSKSPWHCFYPNGVAVNATQALLNQEPGVQSISSNHWQQRVAVDTSLIKTIIMLTDCSSYCHTHRPGFPLRGQRSAKVYSILILLPKFQKSFLHFLWAVVVGSHIMMYTQVSRLSVLRFSGDKSNNLDLMRC